MFERYTERARRVVVLAQEEARALNHNYIGSEHLLLGLIHEGEGVAFRALVSVGISLEAARQQVERTVGRGQQAPAGHIPFTPRAKKALEYSLRETLQLGTEYISTEHILLGLIREGNGMGVKVLVELGATPDRVRKQVIKLLPGPKGKEPAPAASVGAEPAPVASPLLDQFGRNLTYNAREGGLDPVIGREKEIERVMQVLSRRAPSSPILVGEPGVGKSAVAAGLAQRIVSGHVVASFKNKMIYHIDMRALAERTSGREDINAQMRKILGEAQSRDDIIVFLDELRIQAPDIWPILGGGDPRVIGALTPGDYADLLYEHPVVRRTFVAVQVAELSVPQTVEILNGLRGRYEEHHRISIADGALAAAAELAHRRLAGRRLPGKAIDLLDEAAALCRIRCKAETPDLREYDEKVAQVRRKKESAIDAQDFDRAADLRDTEKQLLGKKAAAERDWRLGEVDEELIAETLAIMLGLSPDGAVPAARARPLHPGVLSDSDREVWSLA